MGGGNGLRAELSSGSSEHGLQAHRLARYQFDSLVCQLTHANSWSLQILDDSHRRMSVLSGLTNGLDRSLVRLVGTVRKIQAGCIHPTFNQPV